MKIPKYIEQKIKQRASLQMRSNSLQREIEYWCEDHNIELEYALSHVCLFNEPDMVAMHTLKQIEDK